MYYTRPLVGFATVLALTGVFGLSVVLFNGALTKTVGVAVVVDRAGLVMNADAKVKLRGVQVGVVESIISRPDGRAELRLAMEPSQMRLIPSNVTADIASSTVFGAKYVQLSAPAVPVGELQEGQVLEGDHVTVEVNTIFEQLVRVLDQVEPAKLNQTLGAVRQAFSGRGDKFGQSLSDMNALLAKLEPSLPTLSTEIAALKPVLTAYGDASADLSTAIESFTATGNSIVDEKPNLDAFLVGVTGLADVGNDVVGGNRQQLTDVLHILVPTTDLLFAYRRSLWCGIAGLVPFATSPPQNLSGAIISSGITFGVERYRYPRDLPKVAASSGGRDYCTELGLPEQPPGFVPPLIVGDVGTNQAQYGNGGILLNSEGLKNWLFGPLPGPPRNTAQIGMPG